MLGVPWELLRDPDSNQAVALGAAQFVRTHHQTARAVRLPDPTGEPLQVLLVICRPGGGDDVPFRSVASRLVRSGVDRLTGLDLKVLRPPTFAQLGGCCGRRKKPGGRSTSCTSTGTARSWTPARSLADPDLERVPGRLVSVVPEPGRRGESLLDRLINNSHQLLMNGASYRPQRASDLCWIPRTVIPSD